ncbi:MAG TPA: hypothetical protein VHB46_19325 [Burkholderiales bacterium]|nr:hypothetical protein [Burkholderiales bacterium]
MKATSLALDQLMRGVGDPLAQLHGIAPGDAEYGRAQLIRIAIGILTKSPASFDAIAAAIGTFDAPTQSPLVRSHLAAAEAWIAGNPVLAAECYASILAKWPRDLLALRLAQSCFFYLGWHHRLCEVVDALIPAWPHDGRGFGFVLAIASYAHAENGDAALAEMLGRQALAIDAACPLGVHAVAHAIAESGRPADGARWMRDQVAHWAAESRMRSHNAWHLAMFDAAQGNVASAIGILDGWLLPASAASLPDACDATALLERLSADGVDDAGRWRRISDAFEANAMPGFWPYVDLHAAIAHLSAGNAARVQALSQAIDRSAQGNDYAALRARHVTRPALRALRAWTAGRHAQAVDLFADLQPILAEMGGSHIQLDIFRRIEQDARRRRGRENTAPLPRVDTKRSGHDSSRLWKSLAARPLVEAVI